VELLGGVAARLANRSARAAAVAATALCVSGCGPWGPLGILAGGPFLGAARPAPEDWSFSDAHPLIAIETRGPWYRHTVTVVCVSDGGDLYLMARHAPRKKWARNLMRDPRIRLEIGGELYAARATRVTDAASGEAVARGFLRKYVGIEAERARALGVPPEPGDDRAEVWSFRVEPDRGDAS
jgi:hypothetical protein